MLSPQKVFEIETLLLGGNGHGQPLSQRAAARAAGVARGTAAKIAHGRHPWQQPGADEEQREQDGRPVGRCGRCGRRIELPCRACQAAGFRGQGPGAGAVHADVEDLPEFLRSLAETAGPLGVELTGAHRRRYEVLKELRRRREQLTPSTPYPENPP